MSDSFASGRKSGVVIALIAGIPLTMILMASWLWYFVVQGDIDLIGVVGTANNGTLLNPPRQLKELTFRDDAGAEFIWEDLNRRWTIVVPHEGPICDELCERRLYSTRQIHIALGRDFKRIQRVMVNDLPITAISVAMPEVDIPPKNFEDNELSNYIATVQPGLTALEIDNQTFAAIFPELSDQPNQWFLVDPEGWIMMRFDDSLDYKAVLTDLKFLLKHSGGVQ